MPARRILVSWIGTTDLLSMANELDEPQQKRVCDELKVTGQLKKQDGPIRTLLKQESFQAVHLLSNYAPFLNRLFAKWLGGTSKIHPVKLEDPTDYAGIFAAVKAVLDTIGDTAGAELAFILSPGTPAMAATWILVGKSRHDVAFYQSYGGTGKNLMLHGVDTPDIHYQNTLSNNFPEKFPKMSNGAFDVIMVTPPF